MAEASRASSRTVNPTTRERIVPRGYGNPVGSRYDERASGGLVPGRVRLPPPGGGRRDDRRGPERRPLLGASEPVGGRTTPGHGNRTRRRLRPAAHPEPGANLGTQRDAHSE